jgi:hypothetical protein
MTEEVMTSYLYERFLSTIIISDMLRIIMFYSLLALCQQYILSHEQGEKREEQKERKKEREE